MAHPSSSRREFLQTTAAGLAATSFVTPAEAQQVQQRVNAGGIPLRPLGKTGEMVSLLCLGGHSSTNPQKLSEAQSLRLIQRAVDEGITFMR